MQCLIKGLRPDRHHVAREGQGGDNPWSGGAFWPSCGILPPLWEEHPHLVLDSYPKETPQQNLPLNFRTAPPFQVGGRVLAAPERGLPSCGAKTPRESRVQRGGACLSILGDKKGAPVCWTAAEVPLLYWCTAKNMHWAFYKCWVFTNTCVCICLCAQSCPTLCDPMGCSLPGSSVHGILQARILAWVAISFSKGSSQPRDQTWVSCIAGRFFTIWAIPRW